MPSQTFTWVSPTAQPFVVPAGITELRCTVDGACGGITPSHTRAGGARLEFKLAVTPGETLDMLPGQQGFDTSGTSGVTQSGGFRLGGPALGGLAGMLMSGAGGGGTSTIRRGTSLVALAGAGGGSGGGSAGGNGGAGGLNGTAGTAGTNTGSGGSGGATGAGGGGATTSAVGAAGSSSAGAGTAGSFSASTSGGLTSGGSGGRPSTFTVSPGVYLAGHGGGGGGGGRYGGGGGGSSRRSTTNTGGDGGAGGGGGSSFTAASGITDLTITTGGNTAGNGFITITWGSLGGYRGIGLVRGSRG